MTRPSARVSSTGMYPSETLRLWFIFRYRRQMFYPVLSEFSATEGVYKTSILPVLLNFLKYTSHSFSVSSSY